MPPPPQQNPTATASATLAGGHLRQDAVARAVAALLRWLHRHTSASPSPSPEPIYLILALKHPPRAGRRLAYRLRLPHSPFPCVSLVSDHPAADVAGDIDVLPSSALRALPATARRGLVLADRRLPGINNTKKPSKSNNRIIPVDLAKPSWRERAREMSMSTELRLEGGTCRAVRVAHAAQPEGEVVENVVAAAEAAVACVPKKWRNVRALHVKAPESLALPIYRAPGADDGRGNSAEEHCEEEEEEGSMVKKRKKTTVKNEM